MDKVSALWKETPKQVKAICPLQLQLNRERAASESLLAQDVVKRGHMKGHRKVKDKIL